MSAAPRRSSATSKNKKGPSVGTGGYGRKALEGKGPTPKAEDRPYHKAFKNKELAERSAAKRTPSRGGSAPRGRSTGGRSKNSEELVTGRNSVVEALRAGIPVKALHLAIRIDVDERVRETMKIAAERGIPVMESSKSELDRMTNQTRRDTPQS